MPSPETQNFLAENEPAASTSQNKGLAGKIVAMTTVVLAIGSLLDGLVAVTTKATTLTCNLTISFPWCSHPTPSNGPSSERPIPPTPAPAPPVATSNAEKPTPAPTVPSTPVPAPPVTPTPASPSLPSKSIWTHNNSIMSIAAVGNKITIYYDQPRQGMIDEGVRSGTILFEGQIAANRVAGTSYVFDRRCGRISYSDEGEIFSGERRIRLNGQRVPTQLGPDCTPLAYRLDPSIFDRRD